MSNESTNKQVFLLRDLTTRTVVLFPDRAQIVRDIKEIALKPGTNQIIIHGLAPTVDEHSIKVEGTGAATITDLKIESLPNQEHYEDIYPSDSESESEEETESKKEFEAVKSITAKIKQLNIELTDAQEVVNSATCQLNLLDNYASSVKSDHPSDLEQLLTSYHDEREKIYKEFKSSSTKSADLQVEIQKAGSEGIKLAKAAAKADEKARKEKTKLLEKKARQKEIAKKEKARIKADRESFWPKSVYRITISLEPSTLTPASSRRGSIGTDSLTKVEPEAPTPAEIRDINLTLSYITYSAKWSPRYELNLDTLKSSGTLHYGAELFNTTSETWRDAKVVISTSQTTFSGLNESIPVLRPWHVHLIKGQLGQTSVLTSDYESNLKRQQQIKNHSQVNKPRSQMFGYNDAQASLFGQRKEAREVAAKAFVASLPAPTRLFGTTSNNGIQKRSRQESSPTLYGCLNPFVPTTVGAQPTGFQSLGTTSNNGMQGYSMQGSSGPAYGSSHGQFVPTAVGAQPPGFQSQALFGAPVKDLGFALYDDDVPSTGRTPHLTFEEGAWEETGMTTTYDVPGLKTVAPSNSAIRHKIANIDFNNVIFSHIIIGKLRPVAFLKARIRNNSKITLLKGPLGLTLDGSFLGQATFPRCSSGESFSLPLGVDPAITVNYPKPEVHRSQSGIFSKEDSNIFVRCINIINTKPSTSVELTILDQIPVSQEERLRIEITHPRGLKVGSGDKVVTGTSLTPVVPPQSLSKGSAAGARASVYNNGKEVANVGEWGSAVAEAKKDGEVAWNVKLNPGQGVKLALEYEASFPAGDVIVNAQN